MKIMDRKNQTRIMTSKSIKNDTIMHGPSADSIRLRFSRSSTSNGSLHRPACSLPMPFEGMNRRATPFLAFPAPIVTIKSDFENFHPVALDCFQQRHTWPIRSPHFRNNGEYGRAMPPHIITTSPPPLRPVCSLHIPTLRDERTGHSSHSCPE